MVGSGPQLCTRRSAAASLNVWLLLADEDAVARGTFNALGCSHDADLSDDHRIATLVPHHHVEVLYTVGENADPLLS